VVELQFGSVARDLPHDQDPNPEEDNLLIEAVSLLVQRQRETESWVTEQIDQAHERTLSSERRYAEFEARLAGIEEQLDRLVRDLEPGRGDAAAGQRLARLREQVEDLKSDTDGRPLRSVPTASTPPRTFEDEAPVPRRTLESEAAPVRRTLEAEVPVPRRPLEDESPGTLEGAPPRVAIAAEGPLPRRTIEREAPSQRTREPEPQSRSAGMGLLELMGATPQDRFGVVLIFLGIVAVLYAVLTQLRIG
jgi:hypothetical protein